MKKQKQKITEIALYFIQAVLRVVIYASFKELQ